MSKEMDALREVVETTISDLGQNAKQFQSQIDTFLNSIEPDVTIAVAKGDTRSLEYLKGRVAGRLTRASLGIIYQNRQAFLAATMAGIRMIIRLGLA